jgi:tRNA(Ile)-lysidine synthase
LALLAATVFEGHKTGSRVVGVIVDHGLQDDSAPHTARVVEQMAALGADETASIRVTVDPGPRGIEAGAREARYAALARLADHFGSPLVLLGHTRDDQAETVLLGLTRGSGGRALAGMRRSFEEFARPLLDLTRAQTEAACGAEDIAFWTDPHNSDPRFLRARVRQDVLPVLERELGPGVADALARTADQLRDDVELLDDLADAAYAEHVHDGVVDVAALKRTTARAITTRVVRLAALAAGALASELTRAHVLAVLALDGRPDKEIQLPGHVTAHRDGDLLRFRPTSGGTDD